MTVIENKTFTAKQNDSSGFPHTLILNGARDYTYNGCTFDGDGIKLDNCNNITFNSCTIKNAKRTSGNHQAIQGGGNNNITFNLLAVNDCDTVAQLYGGNNILWTDCQFSRCKYGYKHGLGGAGSITVRRLLARRLRQMGLEFQDDTPGAVVVLEDSAYVEPERYDDDSKNTGPTMAFSLPAAKAGFDVRRCFVDGESWLLKSDGSPLLGADGKQLKRKSQSGWLGVRVGFEVGGTKPLYTNNWVRYVNDAGAITTSTAAQCFNNLVQNCLEPWDYAAPANGIPAASAGSRIEHNDVSVILPVQGGWSLVGVTPPGTTPPTPAKKLTNLIEVYNDGSTVTKPQ